MRQSQARDLRSFLAEPVEELVVEEVKRAKALNAESKGEDAGVEAGFVNPWDGPMDGVNTPPYGMGAQLHDAGVQFIDGSEAHLHGTGARFATPWESTGGQLHEVGARFTQPLTLSSSQDDSVGARLTSPWETNPSRTNSAETTHVVPGPLTPDQSDSGDLTLQQTMPMMRIPELSGAQSGPSPLRPYRLQRYQSRGVPVSLSRSASGALRLRPAGNGERRATADLAPAPQKIVPGESAPALQSWERRRHTIYTWLVLLTLFLLVVLGGIGLDSLIAGYR